MILDKLMEKKDMITYLTFRKEVLADNKKKAVDKIKNVKKREHIIRQIHGRMLEVGYMLKLMREDKIKTRSKEFWRKAANKNVLVTGDILPTLKHGASSGKERS